VTGLLPVSGPREVESGVILDRHHLQHPQTAQDSTGGSLRLCETNSWAHQFVSDHLRSESGADLPLSAQLELPQPVERLDQTELLAVLLAGMDRG
jgi:hypothetical protein